MNYSTLCAVDLPLQILHNNTMENVVDFEGYKKRRQAQDGETVETTVPCGTCSEMLWITQFGNEKILVCRGCRMVLSLGTPNEGY